MNDAQKREFVSEMSDRAAWKKRVKRMSEAQVTAIYLKELARAGRPKPQNKPKEESGEDDIPF